MIFDKISKKVYGSLSKRTDEQLLNEYAREIGFEAIAFKAFSHNGKPFYHTNIILCIGETFIAVCLESIAAEDRERVETSLR